MAFKRILVPLDGSSAAEAALPHAARLARTFKSRLILLRVLDTTRGDEQADCIEWRMRKAEASRYMHGLAASETLAGLTTAVKIDEGRPAECILQVTEESGADLILMSAFGASGESGFPFGGTAHKILGGARTSVAVVRQREGLASESADYRRVLVPIDGSHQAEMALQVAVAMSASDADMEIVVLHLVAAPLMLRREPLGAEEQALYDQVVTTNSRAAELHLNEIRRQFQSTARISCHMATSTDPANTIANFAKSEKVDLLIMASPDLGQMHGLGREGVCRAIQVTSELPLVVLQANGQK